MNLFFPELFIANKIIEFQDELKSSIENNLSDNLITDMFEDVEPLGEIDYEDEAISLFSKVRPLDVKLGLNLDTAKFPSAQIYLPAENQSRTALGVDPESFGYTEEVEDETYLNYQVGEYNSIFYNANYTVAIISTNADQVSYLYHILRWMFQRYIHIFEVNGFEKFSMKGADMRMEQNLIPQTIFMRTLTLDFDYEVKSINKIVKQGAGSMDVDRIKLNMVKILGD